MNHQSGSAKVFLRSLIWEEGWLKWKGWNHNSAETKNPSTLQQGFETNVIQRLFLHKGIIQVYIYIFATEVCIVW